MGCATGLGEHCIDNPIKLSSDIILDAADFEPSEDQEGLAAKQVVAAILKNVRKDIDLKPIVRSILNSEVHSLFDDKGESQVTDHLNAMVDNTRTGADIQV